MQRFGNITFPTNPLTEAQAKTLGVIWEKDGHRRVFVRPTIEDLPGVVIDWTPDAKVKNVTIHGEGVPNIAAERMMRFLAIAVIYWDLNACGFVITARTGQPSYAFAGPLEDYLWEAVDKALGTLPM